MRRLRIEIEREEDGRWIADVVDVPGALAYGATREEAIKSAASIALHAIADRISEGVEPVQDDFFELAPAT